MFNTGQYVFVVKASQTAGTNQWMVYIDRWRVVSDDDGRYVCCVQERGLGSAVEFFDPDSVFYTEGVAKQERDGLAQKLQGEGKEVRVVKGVGINGEVTHGDVG